MCRCHWHNGSVGSRLRAKWRVDQTEGRPSEHTIMALFEGRGREDRDVMTFHSCCYGSPVLQAAFNFDKTSPTRLILNTTIWCYVVSYAYNSNSLLLKWNEVLPGILSQTTCARKPCIVFQLVNLRCWSPLSYKFYFMFPNLTAFFWAYTKAMNICRMWHLGKELSSMATMYSDHQRSSFVLHSWHTFVIFFFNRFLF